MMLCEESRPYVQLVEGREESDPASKENVQRGEWTTDTKFNGVQKLTVARPEASWTTKRSAGALTPDVLLIADGGTEEDDAGSLLPVEFRPTDLAKLQPGQVLTNDKTISLAALGSHTCED